MTALLSSAGLAQARVASGHCEEPDLAIPADAEGDLVAALGNFARAEGVPAGFDWQLEALPARRNRRVLALTFPSPRPSGDEVCDRVWCKFQPARGLAPGARAPAAIVLHHLAEDSSIETSVATYLAASGIHALEVEFPHYGERRREGEAPRAGLLRESVTEWVRPMQQVVSDIGRGATWLLQRDDVDAQRVGVVGISLGGIIGAISCGADLRLKRNVLLLAGGDLARIVQTPSRETAPMRAHIAERGLGVDQLREYFAPIEPLRLAHRIDGQGTLLINALEDHVIPRESTDALAEAIGDPQQVWLPGDHYAPVLALPALLERIRAHFKESPSRPESIEDQEWF